MEPTTDGAIDLRQVTLDKAAELRAMGTQRIDEMLTLTAQGQVEIAKLLGAEVGYFDDLAELLDLLAHEIA